MTTRALCRHVSEGEKPLARNRTTIRSRQNPPHGHKAIFHGGFFESFLTTLTTATLTTHFLKMPWASAAALDIFTTRVPLLPPLLRSESPGATHKGRRSYPRPPVALLALTPGLCGCRAATARRATPPRGSMAAFSIASKGRFYVPVQDQAVHVPKGHRRGIQCQPKRALHHCAWFHRKTRNAPPSEDEEGFWCITCVALGGPALPSRSKTVYVWPHHV